MVSAQSTHASFSVPTTAPQWVPRSPRRATRLHAVFDNGASRSAGRVRDLSLSGAFVEADAHLPVGAKVAVLSLAGVTDKARRPAEVVRVAETGIALHFLDAARESLPSDAPVFLFTDDDPEQAELETTAKNKALLDENSRLKREVMGLQARLAIRLSTQDALQRRVATLEELLQRAMLTGW